MQRRLKMIDLRHLDPSDYKIAGLAMVFGWGAKKLVAIWLAFPWSVQTVIQGLITFALGLGALIVQHFVSRYLNRYWPDNGQPQPLAPPQDKAPVKEP